MVRGNLDSIIDIERIIIYLSISLTHSQSLQPSLSLHLAYYLVHQLFLYLSTYLPLSHTLSISIIIPSLSYSHVLAHNRNFSTHLSFSLSNDSFLKLILSENIYNLQVICTKYIVQCTLHIVHSTMYIVQCMVYNVHYTLYRV